MDATRTMICIGLGVWLGLSAMLDKFPDDGYTWTLNRLEFDELRAGRLDPPLRDIPSLLPRPSALTGGMGAAEIMEREKGQL